MGVAVHVMVGDNTGERQPFNGRCGACDHVWTVCYIPMQLGVAAKMMQAARCPMCGGGKVFVA